MITDVETWQPTRLQAVPPPAAPAGFVEDEDLSPAPTPSVIERPAAAPATAPSAPLSPGERLALMERLEREALAKRFQELDRRSEALAAEQQRVFAQRLDKAIDVELTHLRERREAAMADLDRWAAAERARVTAGLAAEEQEFSDRLMRQLTEFETQLGERLREQEQKLAGWWSEAERLADTRMRAALHEVDPA